MKLNFSLAAALVMTSGIQGAEAAPPKWWEDRVGVTGGGDPNSLVTIGQLKNMAFHLNEEVKGIIPHGDSGLLFPRVPENPTPEWYRDQKKVANIGQLKNVASKFYQNLRSSPYAGTDGWLFSQLFQNGLPDQYIHYGVPWDPSTPASQNYGPATLGQLKMVFSLRTREDSDGNDIPDLFEYYMYGVPGGSQVLDADGDGLTDVQEFRDYSTLAFDRDSDDDGMLDGWEIVNGLDPNDPSDALLDPDDDGLDNLTEHILGSNLLSQDTDSDGLPDAWEAEWGLDLADAADRDLDYDGDSIPNITEFQAGSSPLKVLRKTVIDLPNPKLYGPADKLPSFSKRDSLQNGTVLLGTTTREGGILLKAEEVSGETVHEVIVIPSGMVKGRVDPTHIVPDGKVIGLVVDDADQAKLVFWITEDLNGTAQHSSLGYQFPGSARWAKVLDVSKDGNYVLVSHAKTDGLTQSLIQLGPQFDSITSVQSLPALSGQDLRGNWSRVSNEGLLVGSVSHVESGDPYDETVSSMIVADSLDVIGDNFNARDFLKSSPTPLPPLSGGQLESGGTIVGDGDSGYLGLNIHRRSRTAFSGPLKYERFSQSFTLITSSQEIEILVKTGKGYSHRILDTNSGREAFAITRDAPDHDRSFWFVEGARIDLARRRVFEGSGSIGGDTSNLPKLGEYSPRLLRSAGWRFAGDRKFFNIGKLLEGPTQFSFFEEID